MTEPSPNPSSPSPSRARKRWPLWAALLALLGGGGLVASGLMVARPPPAAFATVRLEPGPVVRQVDATGTVVARGSVQVGSEISGRVARIAVDFNSPVSEGQLLAELASDIYRARVAEAAAEVELAQAGLAVARSRSAQQSAEAAGARLRAEGAEAERAVADASLAFARAEFQRRTAPGREQFVSGSERDRARAELDRAAAGRLAAELQVRSLAAAADAAQAAIRTTEAEALVAEATVRQREAALNRARFDLDRTAIHAPMAGVVIERNVEVGQTVTASLQAPVLFTIAQDLGQMQLELFVDEADVGSLREGQAVDFRVAAFPGRSFSGEIQQLRLAPLLIQNVVTYIAIISAANPERLLRPGMTATVRVKVDERERVPRLPNAALRFRPQRGEAVAKVDGARTTTRNTAIVHVDSQQGLREVLVETGLADERFTEIKGGLPADASVVTGYR
ncbi:MAG: efflux RND transporter periplasmic adaptor subunit [Alphaproteobacteria bacterium]|nr:efflux RND transporter periplasmic adaptor subunit [Alphaproteobacteria bacterium]